MIAREFDIGESTFFVYRTPGGPMTICAGRRGITEVLFGTVERPFSSFRASELTNDAANQIQEYLAGRRMTFDVVLELKGTEFQNAVWEALRDIPYGSTATASQIARAIGREGSHRMVGSAIRQNSLAILVPSHRVVGSNGIPLGNDARHGIDAQLLAFERGVSESASKE